MYDSCKVPLVVNNIEYIFAGQTTSRCFYHGNYIGDIAINKFKSETIHGNWVFIESIFYLAIAWKIDFTN